MKLFSRFFAALAAIVAVFACVPEPDEIKVSGIVIDPSTATIAVGESITLTATVSPETATDKTVKWTSNNIDVAMVENGLVKGFAPGTAVISATANDGGGAAGNCVITVVDEESLVKVTGVSVSPKSLNLAIGDKKQLEATVEPEDATNKNVSWSSSDEDVATVTDDGEVKAIAEGDAEITVKTEDGGKKAVCKVHVSAEVEEATGLSFAEDEYKVVAGQTVTLELVAEPEGAKLPDIKWSSNDTKVATVKNGVVTGKKAGQAVIRAEFESDSDIFAETTVKVTADSDKIKEIEFVEGEEQWFVIEWDKACVEIKTNPDGVDAGDLEIEIGDDESGMSSGKKPVKLLEASGSEIWLDLSAVGDCTMTVSNSDGSVSSSCMLHVRKTPTNFEIDPANLTLDKDETQFIGYKFEPDPESVMKVVFESEDPSIADVDENGEVMGNSYGKTKIIAYPIAVPGMAQTCNVYVYDSTGIPVEYIYLDETDIYMHEEETATLNASIYPTDATTPVAWEADDPDVVYLSPSEDNLSCDITPAKVGKTKVRLRSLVGEDVEAVCNVTVAGPTNVTKISLPATLEVPKNTSKTLSVSVTGSFKTVEWINLDEQGLISLEKMSAKTQIKVKARGNAGDARVRVVVDDYWVKECVVTVMPDGNGHQMVNLGLPSGNMWSIEPCTDPKDKVDRYYYSWGDPRYGNGGFYKSNYLLWDNYYEKYTKYVNNYTYGSRDWRYTLDPEDDPAHVNWGGEWMSPSIEDFRELWYYTEWVRYDDRIEIYKMGDNGPEGDPIVFYHHGYRKEEKLVDDGTAVYYWTNQLDWEGDYGYNATVYPTCFRATQYEWQFSEDIERYYGLEVRPVIYGPNRGKAYGAPKKK